MNWSAVGMEDIMAEHQSKHHVTRYFKVFYHGEDNYTNSLSVSALLHNNSITMCCYNNQRFLSLLLSIKYL